VVVVVAGGGCGVTTSRRRSWEEICALVVADEQGVLLKDWPTSRVMPRWLNG